MTEHNGHSENCFWYAESQAEENLLTAKGATGWPTDRETANAWFDEACRWALIYLADGTSDCQCHTEGHAPESEHYFHSEKGSSIDNCADLGIA
jgi:hypothetical protein